MATVTTQQLQPMAMPGALSYGQDDLAEALQAATTKAAQDARLLAEERGARRRAEATVASRSAA